MEPESPLNKNRLIKIVLYGSLLFFVIAGIIFYFFLRTPVHPNGPGELTVLEEERGYNFFGGLRKSAPEGAALGGEKTSITATTSAPTGPALSSSQVSATSTKSSKPPSSDAPLPPPLLSDGELPPPPPRPENQ